MDQDEQIERQYRAFINSESLLPSTGTEAFELFYPGPEQTGTSSIPFSIPKNLVFGKRIEKFFSHYIQQHPRYQLLAENLQVIQDKTTVGELDFLVGDNQSGEVLHIELACKFYLHLHEPRTAQKGLWTGPNHRDRLDLKLAKMKNRQFPLLYHPETRRLLRDLKLQPDLIRQKLCIQGLLFLPHGQKHMETGGVNPASIKGIWMRAGEFESLNLPGFGFHIPPKENWLLDPRLNKSWTSHREAKTAIQESLDRQKSLMCWSCSPQGEYQRFFVVWW